MKLYSYYRSTAAYRVRIALHLKGVDYDIVPVNLLEDEQNDASYRQDNPQARVPLWVEGDFKLGQSLAIIDYLEQVYPEPALYPADPKQRARVSYLAQIIACDMHPLNNLSVLRYLENALGQDRAERMQWYHHWLQQGFDALEKAIQATPSTGRCCLGNEVTLADICLIPQIYNAKRFNFSMERYPSLMAIDEYCLSLPAFQQASPELQPDAVKPTE